MQFVANMIPLAERAGFPDGHSSARHRHDGGAHEPGAGGGGARRDSRLCPRDVGLSHRHPHRRRRTPSTTSCRRSSSNWSSARGRNTPAAISATMPTRSPKQRLPRWRRQLRRADIRDGQRILDLGCGWGSFALFAAERFPLAQILAVSNSQRQKCFIERKAAERGLTNIQVQTADMNAFQPDGLLRPRGLYRDVRAHVQLAATLSAHPLMAALRRTAVRARL